MDKEKRKKYDEKYSKFNAKDYEEKKYCKECGREIPLGSTESYCQECDDYLDERFSIVQLEILKEKKISKEQIEFLDKFETEEIIDLYLEIRDAFLMGNGIKKDELNILLKLQESFNLGNIKII